MTNTHANHLLADGGAEELGGVVESVHVPGVSDVLLPVLDWALAGLQSLHEVAEHGELSEAAVLDLLGLELSEGIGVVSKAEGVEEVTTCNSRILSEPHMDTLERQI